MSRLAWFVVIDLTLSAFVLWALVAPGDGHDHSDHAISRALAQHDEARPTPTEESETIWW